MASGWTWADAVVGLLLAGTLAGAATVLRRALPGGARVPPGGAVAGALVVAMAVTLLVRDRPGLQTGAVAAGGLLAVAAGAVLRSRPGRRRRRC